VSIADGEEYHATSRAHPRSPLSASRAFALPITVDVNIGVPKVMALPAYAMCFTASEIPQAEAVAIAKGVIRIK
jgi:hypothetical protein